MSINNVQMLRALIREMVTEAPYRSSQRVTLGGVQFDGTPNIRATLIAGGIVGLINLYDWAKDLCAVTDENNNFPIKLSKPAAAAVESSALDAFSTNYDLYLKTISRAGSSVDTTTSDLANLELFYGKFSGSAAAWPSAVSTASGLTDGVKNTDVLTKLKGILGIYTGCGDQVKLEAIPMETRDEYIKFLNDIGDMASSTFKAGLEEQIIRMATAAATANVNDLNAKVTASITYSGKKWASIKTNLGQ